MGSDGQSPGHIKWLISYSYNKILQKPRCPCSFAHLATSL